MIIKTPQEFSADLCFDFLKRSPRELLHQVEGESVFKLLKLGEEKILIKLTPNDTGLQITFVNGTPSAEAKLFIKQYVTEWFDLENDIKPFYALASKDKIMKSLAEKFYGYRIIGQPDLFESIVWAVLGQQINLQFAYTLKQRFVEQFGERLVWKDKSYYLFPEAKLVSGLTDEVLLPLQFSRQKSKYTIGIAEAFASGLLSKEKLKSHSFEDAKAELRKIKGIGNWTANYALMKTFRYPNAFPLEDAGVHNAIKNLKKLDRKPTLEEVIKYYKKFKGWEAYATLYLWKSL